VSTNSPRSCRQNSFESQQHWAAGLIEQVNCMPTLIPDRDCFKCTLEEMALAERLGLEGRERILSRML
jgi:hypothetical protein